jgi:hypothetical protein
MDTPKLTREQLKALSPEDRIKYNNRLNALRVQRYRELNKEQAKEYNRDYKQTFINLPQNKDKYKELNRKNVKAFRDREKSKLDDINAKLNLSTKLTDAIRAKKARNEMKKLKDDKSKSIVSSIVNDIVDAIPKQVALKKNRKRVAKSRANAKIKRTLNL